MAVQKCEQVGRIREFEVGSAISGTCVEAGADSMGKAEDVINRTVECCRWLPALTSAHRIA